MHASCLWLARAGVVDDEEVEEIAQIRRHRNQIAHELPRLLSERDLNLNLSYFIRIRELLEKIEMWWVREFEIPVNPDFDNVDIDEIEILPSRVIMLDYLINVVLAEYTQGPTATPESG